MVWHERVEHYFEHLNVFFNCCVNTNISHYYIFMVYAMGYIPSLLLSCPSPGHFLKVSCLLELYQVLISAGYHHWCKYILHSTPKIMS
jgi:hypothetical protein